MDVLALDVTEAWVREPDEQHRCDALQLGARGSITSPATWLLLAAGWSAPNVTPPTHQTARAVRVAMLMAANRLSSARTSELLKPCLESAMQIAAGNVSAGWC
jgi:Family of unknown function (DUF6931)